MPLNLNPLPARNENEQLAYDLISRDIETRQFSQGSIPRQVAFCNYVNALVDGKNLTEVEIGQPVWRGATADYDEIEFAEKQVEELRVKSVNLFASAPPVVIELTYPYNWAGITTLMPTNFPAVISGATSPLTFSIVTGSLPQGLSLNTTSGLVFGQASMFAQGTSGTIAIQVVDNNGDSDTSPTYSWQVI